MRQNQYASADRIEQWKRIGEYYGYPKCCINAFCSEPLRFLRTSEQNKIADLAHGFVPCPKHAKQIVDGEITLESLISNREHSKPFPDDNDDKEFNEWWNKHF